MKNAIFVIVSRKIQPWMTDEEKYEVARGDWNFSTTGMNDLEKLQQIKYALAVVSRKVVAAYEINSDEWERVGERWKFSGTARDDIRDKCADLITEHPWGRAVIPLNLEEFMAGHEKPDNKEDSMTDTAIELLRQFYQIIFHGPPGTGKTHCAKQLLPELLESPDSTPQQLQSEGRWDIVQFHPSYNYEDFVRGVQVKTVPVKGNDGKADKSEVSYETLNRVFGTICKKAAADDSKTYALIIDEINRANVSAVLGELIYALEYRGEPINTPYDAGDGKALTIPKNLYVIGTMNTADRTIGQIDYAVRRRFAFVDCPPKEQIIREQKDLGKADDNSLKFFRRVDALFVKDDKTPSDFISSDFDAADVRVGHSYFLAAESKLGYKLVYQVVPILREYVKDGVLKKEAESEIQKIEDDAWKLLEGKSLAGELAESDSSADEKSGGTRFYRWKRNEREGFGKTSRVWLAVVRDYVKEYNPKNLQSLISELSAPEGSIREESTTNSDTCYMEDVITLADNSRVVVSYHTWTNPDKFAGVVEQFGYQINVCHIVNIGEGEKPGGESRRWELCSEHNFVSARGKRYVAQIGKLKKGDVIFVNLVDTADKAGGVVACGEVVSERAVAIDEFSTEQGPLLDILVDGGQLYKDRFPQAASGGDDGREYREHIVAVKWIGEPRKRDNGVKISSPKPVSRQDKISEADFVKMQEMFNLGDKGGN